MGVRARSTLFTGIAGVVVMALLEGLFTLGGCSSAGGEAGSAYRGKSNRVIWVMEPDGRNPIRLTEQAEDNGYPDWSLPQP